MPRNRQRLTLESGPVLDLAEIIRRGSGRAGARIRAVYSFSKGEVLATELSLEEHGGTMELAFEDGGSHSSSLRNQGTSADGNGTSSARRHRAEYGCCTDRWAPCGSQAGMLGTGGGRRMRRSSSVAWI